MTTAKTTVIYSNFAGFSSQPAVDWLSTGCPLAASLHPAVENLLFGDQQPEGSQSTVGCDEKPTKFEYETVVISVHGRKRVR